MASPNGFFLGQNYPNPITKATTIQFHLASSSNVSVVMFDELGKEVSFVYNGFSERGDHKIQWTPDSNTPVGNYIAVLKINGENSSSMKVKVVK